MVVVVTSCDQRQSSRLTFQVQSLETKGSNKNKGGNKKKGGRFLTPCSTDDDCAELEGTSCVARPQKEGATKEAKFFCRDPDAIRPSKGKGKGRSKGKGNGNGGNKAVVDGSD